MIKPLIPLLLSSTLLMSGCASNDEDIAEPGFRTARAQSNLELPPDLINTSSAAVKRRAAQSAVPDEVLPDIEGLEIKRNTQGERWLEVGADIDNVWDRLVDYTQNMALPILSQNKQSAIIETEWMGDFGSESKARSKARSFLGNLAGRAPINDKFTFWLERSGDNTTALYVTHRKLSQVIKSRGQRGGIIETAWLEGEGEGFEALEMLRNIKSYFGDPSAQEDISERVVLITTDSPRIIISDNISGSVTDLRAAIVAAEYEVVSENTAKNLIVIRELRKKSGLFAKFSPRTKHGVKYEPYGAEGKTKITATSKGGGLIAGDKALPVLYRLAAALRN